MCAIAGRSAQKNSRNYGTSAGITHRPCITEKEKAHSHRCYTRARFFVFISRTLFLIGRACAFQTKDLPEIVADAKLRNRDKEDHTDEDYNMFLDLIRRMLTYEPEERITPIAALQHPFLQGSCGVCALSEGSADMPPCFQDIAHDSMQRPVDRRRLPYWIPLLYGEPVGLQRMWQRFQRRVRLASLAANLCATQMYLAANDVKDVE